MKRKSISKSTRFEVFKRDSFTCQYCGKSSPKVVLELEHITPVSKGGTNEMINLVTSCFECNRGKGKKELKNEDKFLKQQNEIQILEEKRWQFSMYKRYLKELLSIGKEELELLLSELDIENMEQEYQVKKAYKKNGYAKVKEYFDFWVINCNVREREGSDNLSLSNYIQKKEHEKNMSPEDRTTRYICGILYNKYGFRESNKFKTFFCENKGKLDIEKLDRFKLALRELDIDDPITYWNKNL